MIGKGGGREGRVFGGLKKSLEINSGPTNFFFYILIDLLICLVCIKIITLFPDLT